MAFVIRDGLGIVILIILNIILLKQVKINMSNKKDLFKDVKKLKNKAYNKVKKTIQKNGINGFIHVYKHFAWTFAYFSLFYSA